MKKLSNLSSLVKLCGARTVYASEKFLKIGLIHGGEGNLGDDAMAEAARKALPDFELIRFMHPKQEIKLSRLKLSGNQYFKSAVLGGGTLICPTWSKEVEAALRQDLPVWSLGTGVGSSGFDHADEVDLREWKPLLADFKRIGLRGPRSKAALTSLGLSNVEVIGDLALSLAKAELAPLPKKPKIAINITTPGGKEYRDSKYAALQELETVLPSFVQKGWEIVPIAMHPCDITPLQNLMNRISQEDTSILSPKDADSFFEIISSCSFTVAVRLHAAVLSCCVGTPPLMLGYRDKCLDFMESMKLEHWHISLQDSKPLEISEKLLHLAETYPELRSDILNQSNAWKQSIETYVSSTLASIS